MNPNSMTPNQKAREMAVKAAEKLLETNHIFPDDVEPVANLILSAIPLEELLQCQKRLAWLHDCSGPLTDSDGYEWGIYRVKWQNGDPVVVWQTLSDFSDLDAEMEKENESK